MPSEIVSREASCLRVVGHCRAPAVEHGGGADARSEVLGIGGDREQRLGGDPEQQVVGVRSSAHLARCRVSRPRSAF